MNFRDCKECNKYKLIVSNGKCNSCSESYTYSVQLRSSSGKMVEEEISINERKLQKLKDDTKSWVKGDNNEAHSVIFNDDRNNIIIRTYIAGSDKKAIDHMCNRMLESFIELV